MFAPETYTSTRSTRHLENRIKPTGDARQSACRACTGDGTCSRLCLVAQRTSSRSRAECTALGRAHRRNRTRIVGIRPLCGLRHKRPPRSLARSGEPARPPTCQKPARAPAPAPSTSPAGRPGVLRKGPQSRRRGRLWLDAVACPTGNYWQARPNSSSRRRDVPATPPRAGLRAACELLARPCPTSRAHRPAAFASFHAAIRAFGGALPKGTCRNSRNHGHLSIEACHAVLLWESFLFFFPFLRCRLLFPLS